MRPRFLSDSVYPGSANLDAAVKAALAAVVGVPVGEDLGEPEGLLGVEVVPMAGDLAAEFAGAFGKPDPDALLVDLDDLALPLRALDEEPDAASGVSPDLHSNLRVLHVLALRFSLFSLSVCAYYRQVRRIASYICRVSGHIPHKDTARGLCTFVRDTEPCGSVPGWACQRFSVQAEADAHDLGRLLVSPAAFMPEDGAKPLHGAARSGELVEVLHHRRALVRVDEGLDARLPQGADEVRDLLLPEEIVHLDLVLLAADAGRPGAVGFAGAGLEGEPGGGVLGVPGFQFLAVPAVGVDDGLLAALPLGAGGFPLVPDALHFPEVGVAGVHHGLALLCLSAPSPRRSRGRCPRTSRR